MAFFGTRTKFTVVTEISGDYMCPAVGGFIAIGIRALCRGHGFACSSASSVCIFEFGHHGFENFFEFNCRECSVGLFDNWYIGIGVFIVGRSTLMEKGHVVDILL